MTPPVEIPKGALPIPPSLLRGTFVMRGYGPGEVNTYDCKDCKEDGAAHQIIDQKEGFTTELSQWGPGIPSTIRICTGCRRWDGPWVSADIVGGCW